MRTVRVGLVGFGMAGRVFHAPVITSLPGLKLVKVVERTTAHAKDIYPEVEVVRDIADLIDDAEIELIVIATPNTNHYELAAKVLRAGRHVVVEKPFTVTSEEAADLAKLARENRVVLSVHHNRRFDADFRTIAKLHDEGWLGRVIRYEARFDRFRPEIKPGAWREADAPGSGILYDLGSHLIDQALVLFGLPETVTAFLDIEREGAKAVDSFEIVLEYPDKRVELGAGMLVRNHSLRYRINGTAGSFEKHGLDVQEAKLKQGQRPNDDSHWGEESPGMWGKYLSEKEGESTTEIIPSREGDYRLYYADVHAAIVEGREPSVTAEDGWRVIKIIELAMQSSTEKRSLRFDR